MKNNFLNKKILFLDHTPFIGGAQLAIIDLIKKINRAEFSILIVNSLEAENLGLTKEYQKYQLPYHLIPFTKLKKAGYLNLYSWLMDLIKLCRIVKKESVSLIFTNTIRGAIYGSIVSLLTNRPLVWYLLDYTFPRPLFNLFKFFPKKIFYVSCSVAEYYEGLKVKENKVFYLWTNFIENLANLRLDERFQKRQELVIKSGEILVGYLGRLVKWKGPQILLGALKILQDQGFKNIKVLLAGTGRGQDGNNEDELHHFIITNKLETQVIFAGQQKNIAGYMLALDIYCLTSIDPEPFSSVVLEAMLAKVPVIATDTGGTSEIMTKNENLCLLVKANDPETLAQAIKKVIDNQEEQKILIDQAYQKVKNNYSANHAAQEWEKIFKQILFK